MTFVFYVSRLIVFENQINAGAWKKQTNNQKINTALDRGNAKCDGQEAFAIGIINDTIDEKQSISNRPPSCSAAKKNNKGRPLEQISSATFSSLLSLSLQTSERALTDIANERAQESDRAMVGPPAHSGRTSSSFFSVKVNALPTKLSHTKKLFRDFSPETCPRVHHDESLSCSSAPKKATDRDDSF